MLIDLLFSWLGLIIIALIILPQAIKITREYERGVILDWEDLLALEDRAYF